MAKHRSSSGNASGSLDPVADSLGAAYWSVDDCHWPARSELSEELADLVAPPIIVGTAPVPAAVPRPATRPAPPAARSPRPAVAPGRHRRHAATG
jgi:hypothetical protein